MSGITISGGMYNQNWGQVNRPTELVHNGGVM